MELKEAITNEISRVSGVLHYILTPREREYFIGKIDGLKWVQKKLEFYNITKRTDHFCYGCVIEDICGRDWKYENPAGCNCTDGDGRIITNGKYKD